MNLKKLLRKLKDAEKKSCIENAYCHIVYELFDNVILDSKRYSIVDVSSWSKKNKNLFSENIIAVPDFVITSNDYKFEKTSEQKYKKYGCIEVKFNDSDMEEDRINLRLNDGDKIGYLTEFETVIYTNGWIWKIYNRNEEMWNINLRIDRSQEAYNELVKTIKLYLEL